LSDIMATASGTAFGAAASFAGTRVHLPERVQIRDDVLEWSEGRLVRDIRGGRIDGACLRRFVRLVDAPPEQIAGFARRYGPLYLGAHGYPVAEPDDLPSRIDKDVPPIIGPYISGKPLVTNLIWRQEPIAGWRAWARYVGTALVLSHELRVGERIVPDVRLKRCGLDPGPKNPEIDDDSPLLTRDAEGTFQLSELGRTVYDRLWPWRLLRWLDDCKTADDQWDLLVGDVNLRLLQVADYAVRLDGTLESPQVELGRPWFQHRFGLRVDSALPTIAGQLLATVSEGQHTQLCAGCRLPYPVKRRRENGRCPECRLRARSASAQRSKAKRRAKGSTMETEPVVADSS
jgi:hypothetical protein